MLATHSPREIDSWRAPQKPDGPSGRRSEDWTRRKELLFPDARIVVRDRKIPPGWHVAPDRFFVQPFATSSNLASSPYGLRSNAPITLYFGHGGKPGFPQSGPRAAGGGALATGGAWTTGGGVGA